MTTEEFEAHLKSKMKGIIPEPRVNAEMLEKALEIGEEVLHHQKELDIRKTLLAQLKVHFPMVYREAYIIFNKKPEK